MNNCDHICILTNNELVHLSELKETITCFANSDNIFTNKIKPEFFVDKRRGYSTIFDFCPMCGEKLNWNKIKNNLKGSL